MMIDETGKRYGRLTVVRYDHTDKTKGAFWFCICDCGLTTVANGARMRRGTTKSCGCLKREAQIHFGDNTRAISSTRMKEFNKTFWTEERRQENREKSTVHGGTGTRLFDIWSGMRERCYGSDKDHKRYYKDKGITICDEWSDFEAFREWSLANGYHDQDPATPYKYRLSIDRVDPKKGYCPENCQWITISENSIRRNQYYANQRRRDS